MIVLFLAGEGCIINEVKCSYIMESNTKQQLSHKWRCVFCSTQGSILESFNQEKNNCFTKI